MQARNIPLSSYLPPVEGEDDDMEVVAPQQAPFTTSITLDDEHDGQFMDPCAQVAYADPNAFQRSCGVLMCEASEVGDYTLKPDPERLEDGSKIRFTWERQPKAHDQLFQDLLDTPQKRDKMTNLLQEKMGTDFTADAMRGMYHQLQSARALNNSEKETFHLDINLGGKRKAKSTNTWLSTEIRGKKKRLVLIPVNDPNSRSDDPTENAPMNGSIFDDEDE